MVIKYDLKKNKRISHPSKKMYINFEIIIKRKWLFQKQNLSFFVLKTPEPFILFIDGIICFIWIFLLFYKYSYIIMCWLQNIYHKGDEL